MFPRSMYEGRNPPRVSLKSRDMEEWVIEQMNRCLHGFSDGGYTITGKHYFFINFCFTEVIDNVTGNITLGHIRYNNTDAMIFKEIDAARKEEKGLLLITGRGFGKSIIGASIVTHEFVFFPTSHCFISASTEQSLTPLWDKTKKMINYLPLFFKPKLAVNDRDTMESGYKTKKDGVDTTEGFRSKIEKIIFSNKAGATRGARPNIHIFEEIGSWTASAKLKDCYNMSAASWWRGIHFTCFPFLIGTGGEMESGGSEDASHMFYNPDAYRLRSFRTEDEKTMSLFVPAYMKLEGTYSEDTMDIQKAKDFLNNRREEKKNDMKTYNQEIQEFPFEPEEAFMITGSNSFDSLLIYNQILKNTNEKVNIQRGNLNFVKVNGKIMGVEWQQHDQGDFEILEHPFIPKDKTEPVEFMYVSGCDSYDSAETDSRKGEDKRSKGAIVMRKAKPYKDSYNCNVFVAKCVTRDLDAVDFYWKTVKLNMYYNAKMLYEHTKIGILQHYNNHKLLRFLMLRPKVAYKEIQNSVANNKYGLAMSKEVKNFIINALARDIKDNIDEYCFNDMLLEFTKFRYGSPEFDTTMACALAVCASEELFDLELKEKTKIVQKFPTFVVDEYGNFKFA